VTRRCGRSSEGTWLGLSACSSVKGAVTGEQSIYCWAFQVASTVRRAVNMVLMRRDRRASFGAESHRAGRVGSFGGCACCEPGSRREVVRWQAPLPLECKVAFLMAAQNNSVPRLAEGCVPSMRNLPQEVCFRIFAFCVSTETRVVTRPAMPDALRGGAGAMHEQLCGLSL